MGERELNVCFGISVLLLLTDFYWPTRAQRFAYAKRRARRDGEFVERNRRIAAFEHGRTDGAHFLSLSFVLMAKGRRFILTPVSVRRGALKIVDHENLSIAENLNSLFGKRFIAFGKISN